MSAPKSSQRGQPKTAAAIIRDLETRDLLGVAKEIARNHHVTLEELLGRRRRGPEASARHELWHRLYEQIPSLPKLGEIFGRDHTTIMAGVHKHDLPVDAASLVAIPETSPSSCAPDEPTQCTE